MSTTSPTALACVEVASIATGYVGLARVSELELEVVEASVVGGARFMMVLRGDPKTLAQAAHLVQKEAIAGTDGVAVAVESETLAAEPHGLLDAMYSLASQRLEETLVVVEAGSMSAMFAAAEALLSAPGTRAIEVKPLRGAVGGALGFFTGPAEACGLAAENARSRWKSFGRTGRIECVDRPNDRFRARFNLDGRP